MMCVQRQGVLPKQGEAQAAFSFLFRQLHCVSGAFGRSCSHLSSCLSGAPVPLKELHFFEAWGSRREPLPTDELRRLNSGQEPQSLVCGQ